MCEGSSFRCPECGGVCLLNSLNPDYKHDHHFNHDLVLKLCCFVSNYDV